MRFAAFFVKFRHNSAQEAVSFGLLEPHRSAEAEHLDDVALLNSEAGKLRTRHSGIGNISGSAGENALVRSLNVGMSSENAGNSAVEVEAHSLFFGGGLSVEVHEDVGSADICQYIVDSGEGVVEGLHERGTHEVDHGYGESAAVEDAHALSGSTALRIISRTDNAVLLEDAEGLLAAEGVVACGYDVSAGTEEHISGGSGDTVALRGILAVHNGNVHGVHTLYEPELAAQEIAAGFSDNIADE